MVQSRERLFREPFRDLIAVHLSRDVRHVGARTLPSQTHHHRPRQRMRHNLPRRELTRGRASLTIVRPHARDVKLSIPSLGAPPRERRLVRTRRRRARERRPSPARLRPIASYASSLLERPSSQRVRTLPSRRVRSSTHASRAVARRRRVPAREHPSHARVRRERHPRTHAQSIHRVDDGSASTRTVLSLARARHHRPPRRARASAMTRAGELMTAPAGRPACRCDGGARVTSHESRVMTHDPSTHASTDRGRSYSNHSNVRVRTNESRMPEIDRSIGRGRAWSGTPRDDSPHSAVDARDGAES